MHSREKSNYQSSDVPSAREYGIYEVYWYGFNSNSSMIFEGIQMYVNLCLKRMQ